MKLSDKCRTEALKDPQGCRTAAHAAAAKACKGVTGRGGAACIEGYFEQNLAKLCGPIVCPGDPFMLKESAQSTAAKASTVRANEGGFFDAGDQDLILQQEREALKIEQGMASSKMKFFLLAGVGVLVILAMRKKS